MLERLTAWVKGLLNIKEPSPLKIKAPRKKSDTTKFTQQHFDFIVAERARWVSHNEGKPRAEKISIVELCNHLNQQLNMDKSPRALSRIWNGEIDRDDLPTGQSQCQ